MVKIEKRDEPGFKKALQFLEDNYEMRKAMGSWQEQCLNGMLLAINTLRAELGMKLRQEAQ